MIRIFRPAVLVLCLVFWGGQGLAQQPVEFPVSQLTIETAAGSRPFIVEVATDPQQHAFGLMYRRSLQPDHGMLFIYDRAQEVSMWMKNTYIPLDMLFIDAAGRIVRIAANMTPLSTDIHPSSAPVKAVLEIAGGTAARLGIENGNRVVHPALAPDEK